MKILSIAFYLVISPNRYLLCMNPDIEKHFLGKAELFKALSHPTRLYIIFAINETKMSVKELAKEVGVDISTMSKHLDILKRARIIEGEKVKNFIYYRLAIPCVLDFMNCATKVVNKE